MNKTLTVKTQHEKWYLIDAKGKTLGRLASKITTILLGKQKATYTPYYTSSDKIIIVNAKEIEISGKKTTQKLYRSHSGRPGGMSVLSFNQLKQKAPTRILELAVKGMLPKGARGRELFRNLKVYSGNDHPHEAQLPETLI